MAENVEIDGLVKEQKQLEALMMSNPEMEKRVQGLIRKVLMTVRRAVAQQAKGAMKSDPRQAYKAVRSAVYKRILGGNVNILQTRRASGGGSYTPTRTLKTGQRGGNRRLRSERTMKMESYVGADRGFVLRFLNAGTNERGINFTSDEAREHVHRGSQGGNLQKYGKTINTGRRGAIAPRNFFGNRSHMEMEQAAKNLETLIDNLIKKEIA
jgi:hypothetical protein